MSDHTKPKSNNANYEPMPMSVLLAKLLPLQTPDSASSSYSSIDDSDDSASEATSKNPTPKTVRENQIPHTEQPKKTSLFTTPKPGYLTSVKKFSSEKKYSRKDCNKENYCSHSSNLTFPSKDEKDSVSKNLLGSERSKSEVKKLVPHHNSNTLESHKRTPVISKAPQSSQKSKPLTPIIKSGIRRFTPGSGHRSQKKTPTKLPLNANKESAKCLFPENSSHGEYQKYHPPPSREVVRPVPETPLNKATPVPYAATPSYPQGVVGNDSKMMLKTTAIKGKRYIYIKKLGIGGSSEVYKVIEVGTSCEYAVKCVDLATDKELAQGYINEVRLLRELQNSDRVIRMFDYEYDRTTKFLRVVLEAGETDLSSFLKSRGSGLSPALVIHYWEEMLNAVHYIHEQGVIHADLKPANFLLVCGKLKLIDFGIASAVAVDATSVVRDHATGTYSYISPEALMGGAGGYGNAAGDAPIKITFRSDVWSLGCILYSMVYGRTPFSHIPNLAKLAAILDPKHKIDYPPVQHFPPSLISALKWCLTYNAKSRPWVRELLAIPYLQYQNTPLPQSLTDKLQSCLTPLEFQTLLGALKKNTC